MDNNSYIKLMDNNTKLGDFNPNKYQPFLSSTLYIDKIHGNVQLTAICNKKTLDTVMEYNQEILKNSYKKIKHNKSVTKMVLRSIYESQNRGENFILYQDSTTFGFIHGQDNLLNIYYFQAK